TGAEPLVALIIRAPPARRQVGRQEDAARNRVAHERIEHQFDLALRSVRPDRKSQKNVEPLAEYRRIESIVGVEPRPLRVEDAGLENLLHAELQPLGVRLDAAIAIGIEEMNQPVPEAQHAAAEIDELHVGIE